MDPQDELDRTFEYIERVRREIIHIEGSSGWCANVYQLGNPMPIAVGHGKTRETAREAVGLSAKEDS